MQPTFSSLGGMHLAEIFLILCAVLVLLALLPRAVSYALASAEEKSLYKSIVTVSTHSSLIGMECPNEQAEFGRQYVFKAGDVVITCVRCGGVHHLRCWDFNQGRCMNRTCDYEMRLPPDILDKYLRPA
jgi:hypothetical protein